MKEIIILGIRVTDRVANISRVQDVLTKFGCSIRTRLGLHDLEPDLCSGCGLILLELSGSHEEAVKLENELLAINGVEVKKMVF